MTGYALTIYRDDEHEISIDELAHATGVHPSLVERFVECGLLEPSHRAQDRVWFEASAVFRVRSICRLRHDLGANVSSVSLILDLVDRVGRLEREIAQLRAVSG